MERFYNDDDSDDTENFFGSDDDDDQYDEPEDGEAIAFIDQEGLLDVMNIDLAQMELNQHLLSKAIEIASQSWFWRWKSATTRLDEIEMIYRRLLNLIDEDEDREIEGE